MYRITRFGTVDLPDRRTAQYIGAGSVDTGMLPLAAGGAYDPYGSEDNFSRGFLVSWQGGLITSDEYRGLRAMFGKRRKLHRTWDDGATEWVWARLVKLDSDRMIGHKNHVDARADFDVISAVWNGDSHGDGWVLDSGEYLDDGLTLDEESGDEWTLYGATTNIVINNAGNAIAKNVTITIIPGTTDTITAVTITKTGETDITYTGTINPSQTLVIDCGAWSVENNLIDDYDGLTFGANHAIDGILQLDPGDNTITITKTGGNIDDRVIVSFYDAWD
jgi:hypothetical protein